MIEQEQKAVLTACLMAAFADGSKHERERNEIRNIAETLAGEASIEFLAKQLIQPIRRRCAFPPRPHRITQGIGPGYQPSSRTFRVPSTLPATAQPSDPWFPRDQPPPQKDYRQPRGEAKAIYGLACCTSS